MNPALPGVAAPDPRPRADMRITVVIPTYNAAAFLRPALASVLGQSRPPDELVVVDDASPDDTAAVAREALVGAGFPTAVVRLDANSGGPARPLNVGIDRVPDGYVALLDHDDRMAPGWLAAVTGAVRAAPECGLYVGGLTAHAERPERDGLIGHAAAYLDRVPQRPAGPGVAVVAQPAAYHAVAEYGCFALSCSALAFPKSTWAAVGGFDESVTTCADFAFLEAVARRSDIGLIRHPAAAWTYSPTSLVHHLRRRFWEVSGVMARVHAYYQTRGTPADLRPRLRRELLARAYGHVCESEYRAACRVGADSVRRYGGSPAHVGLLARASLRAARNLFQPPRTEVRP